MVANLIAVGEFVTALGTIALKKDEGMEADYDDGDVWRFRDEKMIVWKAFIIRCATGKNV